MSCSLRERKSQSRGQFLRWGCVAAAVLSWQPAVAETLQEALVNAYLINPALNAERARLRATDEGVALAKSGLRPTITAGGDTAFENVDNDVSAPRGVTGAGAAAAVIGAGGFPTGTSHPRGWDVTVTQPVFTGLQNINAIHETKATVQAGREDLRTIEQTTLLDAATAYMNVVRDQAVVRLRENNVTVLTEQLKQTRDRFNLVTPSSIAHLLPRTLEEAMTQGDGENPVILSAVYKEESSLYTVNRIIGELLPTAKLQATYGQRFGFLNTPDFAGDRSLNEEDTVTVMGRVNVPLYQGGGVAARVRQAKETNNQFKREVEDARLHVHADVSSNWGILQSTALVIKSARDAVRANGIALAGVQEEAKVGQRTTLDVLNAQLELVTSQIALVTAQRDQVVAEYSLCAAVGRLDAQSLGLSAPYYSPTEHFDTVTNKWFGLTPPPPPAPDE
jgi:outer membrane protein